jgi:hypothetical protein
VIRLIHRDLDDGHARSTGLARDFRPGHALPGESALRCRTSSLSLSRRVE